MFVLSQEGDELREKTIQRPFYYGERCVATHPTKLGNATRSFAESA
jgi:hypothetical protein